jgi:hypothetical protein
LYHRAGTAAVIGNDNSNGGDVPPVAGSDRSFEPLEEPVADRVTLARRLRAVERALSGIEGVEFDPATADARDVEALAERLDAAEARLDALGSAVRAIGECLVARDRARRTNDGVESVRRAVDALPGTTDGADDAGRSDRLDDEPDAAAGTSPEVRAATATGGEGVSVARESATEWLDRVAAGGVSPPPVE